MFPFFETIAIQDGKILNPLGHQQRYEQTLRYFYSAHYLAISIAQIFIPIEFSSGLVRCRMNYNAFEQEILFFPYQKRHLKTFQLIIANQIEYNFKYSMRKPLENLFSQRGNFDEIMIIRNSYVTDCSIGNLVFLKQGEWFTPTTPLLNGTQRQKLIRENKIQLREIKLSHLEQYEEIKMINALNSLEI